MSKHMTSRLTVILLVGLGPILSIGACGGSDDTSIPQDDAATYDVVPFDTSTSDDDAIEAATVDGSKSDAYADAGVADAAKTVNRCGGYEVLELGGKAVTPGTSCGTCGDGTIACTGSNTVACAGATSPPCPTPPFDAGPNVCGGYGPLTFLSKPAAIGDSCGECGQIECGSANSLVCATSTQYCGTDAGLQSTCTIPGGAYTATPTYPTLPAETRPTTTSMSSIGLPATDLAYDPYDGFLYASTSYYATDGNGIAKIDPVSATVVQTIYVGANPTHIALSDDGKALWVALGNSSSVRRVDLTTFTAGDSFALPTNNTVSSIQVIAGTEDSVAVTRYESYPTYAYATGVYDNGIPRPYGLRFSYSQILTFGPPSPSLFFSYSNGYPSSAANAICVDANGAFLRGSSGQVTYYGTPKFYEGLIYNTDGTVYDAQTGTLAHTFTLPASSYPYYSAVTVDTNDVYYLTLTSTATEGYWVQVMGYDRTTYAATINDLLAVNGNTPYAFTRWGRYGFAYLSGSTSVQIARSTIIPDMP